MRQIADIPNPNFKISIFSFNQKYLMKFEQGNLEQTYKISEFDAPNGLDSIKKIMVNEAFLSYVTEQFMVMRQRFNQLIEVEFAC